MEPFLDVLGLISASLLVRSHYRKMPILASLNAKNRPKSPFSIGMLFSIISEFTVFKKQVSRGLRSVGAFRAPPLPPAPVWHLLGPFKTWGFAGLGCGRPLLAPGVTQALSSRSN